MNINQELKDKAILSGWIAGLILLISIIWIFSQTMQANFLLRSVNNVLINNNDSRRLSAFIQKNPANHGLLGYWYSINNSADQMFVFTVFNDGILVPLGAIVSSENEVEEIIPLSSHAIQIFDNIPQRVLQVYITRIVSMGFKNTNGSKR